jgi:propanol-preferring alcohol dehydrogenase
VCGHHGVQSDAQLRHEAGELIAVQGIGGLGHLGIQYARPMGLRTVTIGRGADQEPLAKKLGRMSMAIRAQADPAAELRKLGGARLILATAPDAKSMSALVGGLSPTGKLLVMGVPTDPLSVSAMHLVMAKTSVQGWPSGSAIDWEDTLNFSVLIGVRPMIEKYPLSRVNEAYDQMISGKARFRVVLRMGELDMLSTHRKQSN